MLGIKTEDKASQAAYHVPQYLQQTGCKIIPVPGLSPEGDLRWLGIPSPEPAPLTAEEGAGGWP